MTTAAARDRTAAGVDPASPRLYYDATLIVTFGTRTPVGVVRVDHYVAEFLARDPAIDLQFVMFDTTLGRFRALTDAEAALLVHVLFHRYEPAVEAPPAPPEPDPPGNQPLLRRLRTAASLSTTEFHRVLAQYAARLLPVTARHGVSRRVATRVLRGIAVFGARCVHRVVRCVATVARRVVAQGVALARRDAASHQRAERLTPDTGTVATGHDSVLQSLCRPVSPVTPAGPARIDGAALSLPEPRAILFNGGVLLSLGNAWDYMDYGYLHRIVRDDGIRFLSVVYDVIAMRFPFTTPGPAHLYHRHWVEIGHCATHLLAISRFAADQYTAFIAEPNGLSPPMSHAYLPNFPRERAAEIGEAPVRRLPGRRFVVYCSTIEARKNHQLLLHLWDRLRQEFSADALPILVFAGKWGWGAETVRLIVERDFHLRDHLLVLDQVSDAELIWLYRNACFTLFPSLAEGYGLAASESLSFGTPVVVSDCPGLIEATEGLMPAYDPLDFMAWLGELRGLIGDDRKLAALREAASQYQGPAYETFAEAIRAIVIASSEQQAAGEPCLVA